MPFRLKKSAFDVARPVLDQVTSQGWIWRGHRKLDGLCCVKSWFEGDSWVQTLTPWLSIASQILESDSHVLVLFSEQQELDCNTLGRVLPLVRVDDVYCSFPASFNKLTHSGRASLKEHLLLYYEDERQIESLDSFTELDPVGWWSLDDVIAIESSLLPVDEVLLAQSQKSRSSIGYEAGADRAGFSDVHKRLSEYRTSFLTRMLNGFAVLLGGVGRILIWGLIGVIIYILVFYSSEVASDINWEAILIGLLVLAILFFMFVKPDTLIGPGGVEEKGGYGSGGQGYGEGVGYQPRYRPGLFSRMAGWMLWNSALGTGMRRKYGQRLREVEELFAKGKIDEALRKAMPLGKQQKNKKKKKRNWFGDFPISGPDLRDSLSIRYHDIETPGYSILSEPGYEALRAVYEEQARKLADEGDQERAAFIYAELLNDVESAVRVFEQAGNFEVAAKLAQGRRLGPRVFIPLWFKAGKKERALKLAAQHDAFELLSQQVDKSDPFHTELVKEWTKRLIEAGDFVKALDLTEDIEKLKGMREHLILSALNQVNRDAKVIARALRCMSDNHFDVLQDLFEAFLAKEEKAFIQKRIELAEFLADKKFEKMATVDSYFSHRLPVWGLTLLRKLMADEAQFGADDRRRKISVELSEVSGQLALRVDIRRLNRITGQAEAPASKQMVLETRADLVRVQDVVAVSDNRILVAYETGALDLLNHKGRKLWSDTVYNIRGMVPIGAGTRVLIIRDELQGCALSLLDLSNGSHKNIGFYNIQAYHHHANEVGWMVFADNKACMLDMSSLVAAANKGGGQLEHLWSIPVSEPGRLCSFRDQGHEISFLYQRKEGELLESWTLNKSNLQVDCAFVHQDNVFLKRAQSIGWLGQATFCAYSKDNERIEKYWFQKTEYSYQNEKKLLKKKTGWLLPDQDLVSLSHDTSSVIWSSRRAYTEKVSSVPSSGEKKAAENLTWYGAFNNDLNNPFTVELPQAEVVKAFVHDPTSSAIVFDDLGRIVSVDMKAGRVVYRNDS